MPKKDKALRLRRRELKQMIVDRDNTILALEKQIRDLGEEPGGPPRRYVIGPNTAELVFRRNRLENMHGSRFLRAIEMALPDVPLPPYGWGNLTPADDLTYAGKPVRVVGSATGGMYDLVYRDTRKHVYPNSGGDMVSARDPNLIYHGPFDENSPNYRPPAKVEKTGTPVPMYIPGLTAHTLTAEHITPPTPITTKEEATDG